MLDSLLLNWLLHQTGNSTISHTWNITTLYHCSLFAGHQDVIKTYLTIGDKFFIPALIHYLQPYIKGCNICQLSKNDKLPTRQLQTKINLNYKCFSRLSMDLKVMLRSYKGHKYIWNPETQKK